MKADQGSLGVERQWQGWVRVILSAGISVGALAIASREVDWREIWLGFAQTRWGWVGLALLSLGLNMTAKAVRWKYILRSKEKHLSINRLFGVILIGQMINYVLPGRVGDFSRAYYLRKDAEGFIYTAATVYLEKLIDLVVYIFIWVGVLVLLPSGVWAGRVVLSLVVMAFFAIGTLAALRYRFAVVRRVWSIIENRLPERLRERVRGYIQAALASLDLIGSKELWWVGMWTVVIWFTAVLNNFLIFGALSLPMDLRAAMVVLAIVQAGLILPSAPGNLGVFELGVMLGLSLVGITGNPALRYGILLHGLILLPTLVAGLSFFWVYGSDLQTLIAWVKQKSSGLRGGRSING